MDMMLCTCGEWMRVKKNGVTVRPKGYYGYFKADLWYCPKCGTEILAGFSKEIVTCEEAEFDFENTELV